TGAQASGELTSQRTPALDEQSLVDRLVRDAPRSVAGRLDWQPVDDLATAFGLGVPDMTVAALVEASHFLSQVLRGPLEPGQYLSIRYTERVAEPGAVASVGSRADS